jgi:hypothetical protein
MTYATFLFYFVVAVVALLLVRWRGYARGRAAVQHDIADQKRRGDLMKSLEDDFQASALPTMREDFCVPEFTSVEHTSNRVELVVRWLQQSVLFLFGSVLLGGVALGLVVLFRFDNAWLLLGLPLVAIGLAGSAYDFMAERRRAARRLR